MPATGDALIFQGTSKAPKYSTVVPPGAFQGRLSFVSVTKLNLGQYSGDKIEINGEFLTLLSGGLDLLTTDNTITAAGLDSGGGMGITTRYSIYVSNSKASFAPGTVRATVTTPVVVNGSLYLDNVGNALNWRFVGTVYVISNAGVPNFADSLTQRYVSNYWNKRQVRLYRCPGYVDDGNRTSYNVNTATWGVIKANDYELAYIDNGIDVAEFYAQAYHEDLTETLLIGIGLGIITGVRKQALCPALAMGCVKEVVAPIGVAQVSVDFLAVATNTVVIADDVRNGSVADPAVTFIEGWVWA